MPCFDLRKATNKQNINTDICIIGAGAAGSVLALELAKTGRNIVLVESGSKQPDQSTQSLYNLEFIGLPFRENFVNRVREYGGSCNTWTGRAMCYTPADFEKKAWVEQSGWPIDFSILKKYYQRAATYLNLPAFSKFDLAHWYPHLSESEKTFFQSQHLKPTQSLWARQPARFGYGSKYQQKITSTKNIDTYLWANLSELELHSPLKSVKKAQFRSLNGNHLSIEAKTFVLACGGLENARLLLLSNKQIPAGLGNQHDNVGRYFMDHPKFEGGIIQLFRPVHWNYMSGRPTFFGKIRIGLALKKEVQQKENLLNPYLTLTPTFFKDLTKVLSIGKMTEDQPLSIRKKTHAEKLARHYLRNALRPPKVEKFKITNYLEQAPDRESRVYLSEKKDVLGLNKLVLDWKVDSKALESIERVHYYLDQHLKDNKLGRVQQKHNFSSSTILNDASHHIGTTRMSERPTNGVVDQNCKVFGLDNLFIAGSSVFPTAGHANPTFTILALAIRLASYIQNNQIC